MSRARNQERSRKSAPPGSVACVLGLGRSGLAATALLMRMGWSVRGLDRQDSTALRSAWQPYGELGAKLITGPHPLSALDDCSLLIRSPGVPANIPILEEALRRGITIQSELSLAANEIQTPIIAITGTNGKSTTTAWAAHLLRRAGIDAVAAGNIGHALSRAVVEEGPETIFVVEVSSFQLEDSSDFHPRAACILNLTPDHLDRHGTFEAYAEAKWSITANQTGEDTLVLGPGVEPPQSGLPVQIVCVDQESTAPTALSLPGPHNLINGLVALALASTVVDDPDRLIPGLEDFPGLPHRMEEVGKLGSVRLVNDSKSTNVDSLRVALMSYEDPVVLIAGGRDKQGAFEELTNLVTDAVKHLVVIGEASARIQAAWPQIPASEAESLDEAITIALSAAPPNGVILLSPGCASFDMFSNFEERGDIFRELVRRRIEAGESARGVEQR